MCRVRETAHYLLGEGFFLASTEPRDYRHDEYEITGIKIRIRMRRRTRGGAAGSR